MVVLEAGPCHEVPALCRKNTLLESDGWTSGLTMAHSSAYGEHVWRGAAKGRMSKGSVNCYKT